MTRSQVATLSTFAVVALLAAIVLIVLSPSGSLFAGGERFRHLRQEESWLIHAAMFGAFGAAIGTRLAAPLPSLLRPGWVLAVLVTIAVFAAVSELAQLEVPSRGASLGDWVADMTGAAAGLWIAARVAPPVIEVITVDQPRYSA